MSLARTGSTGTAAVPNDDGTRGKLRQVFRGNLNLSKPRVLGKLVGCHISASSADTLHAGALKRLTNPLEAVASRTVSVLFRILRQGRSPGRDGAKVRGSGNRSG